MIGKHLLSICFVFMIPGMAHPLLAETDSLPFATIELEKNVHFMTPNDEDVVVPPGFYTVEAAPKGFQLIGGITPHEAGEAFLIKGNLRPYEEAVDQPTARSMALDEDAHYLALLLPDGQILETIGSYSGVRSRGENFFQRILRELREKERLKQKGLPSELTEDELDLIARRDALLSAREADDERRKRLAREKEQALKNPAKWKGYCSNRHPSHVNNHNNCCVRKYDTCLRTAKTFKASARRGFKQTCQALNRGCWIKRKTANIGWMWEYCDSPRNLKKIRVSNRKKCCSKMYKRCYKSSLSVPTDSRRQESKVRCKQAKDLCQAAPAPFID